jgi:phenylalanyl-tRNA synthetase alpha chain
MSKFMEPGNFFSHEHILWRKYMNYINSDESSILELLSRRTDHESLQIKRLLSLPDLSRTQNTPVFYITEAIKKIPSLVNSDTVSIPRIISTELNFDLLGFPKTHPGRSRSDTYYVTGTDVLRTQTTTMWSYYLRDSHIISKLESSGSVQSVCHGNVYRKDEIDRNHYPVFHQIDGLCVTRRDIKEYTTDDLAQILIEIAQSIFGSDVKYQIEPDTFPFTEPSIQLHIYWNEQWLEIVGAGLVNTNVLTLLGIDSEKYNGWAFGFGLDRIAMIKMNIPDIRLLWSTDERITRQFNGLDSRYTPVSKYPSTDRDISVIVRRDVAVNDLFGAMRDCGFNNKEDLIEEVSLLDSFENEIKFGKGHISYTFRIRYRSHSRTLTTEEINGVQELLRLRIVEEFGAKLR